MAGYITVLLQKSNPAGDWGFKMGPTDPAASVVITQIDKDCVAAELLEPGDRIIEIEGMETSKLSVEELQSILGNPSKKLSMVVLKKTLPKGNCSVKKTTVQEVQTVEETKEEIERKKEYEVLLEVSPKDSIDDVINDIKGKIERGEKIDAKEMQIISSCNKNVEQSTSTFDSTKHTIQRDFGTNQKVQFLGPGRHSEILKRKEKFLSQQKKEETVECENVKLEQQSMEEKKKKSNSFWTDPPSDLKHAIENNQYWKRNENGEHITTSAIFSHLNDLHNVQRKGSAREEKRQFWENCRKKYGVDPPASKYHLSHRPLIQMDNNRSKSCEPEHLDRSNPFRREDYRQTNPFYSPTPTNPFYEDYHKNKKSEEKTSGALSKTTKVASSAEDLSKESCKSHEGVITEALKSEKAKKAEAISESYREDFNSKCEFFERATSVPTASCVKNAQDIVSERMAPQVSPLKKPSDFINQVNAEKRTNLTRSQSKEEKATGEQQTQSIPQIQRQRSVSVTEPLANVEEISALQRKVFLGQSVQKQYASSSTSHSSNQCESQETKSAQGHEAHCQMTNVTQHTSGNVSCEQKAFLGQGVQNQYASNLTSQANNQNQNQSQEVHNLVTTQTDSSENAAYEKKSFLGQSVQKQFVTGITNSSNEIQSSEEQSKEHVIDIKKENNYEKNKPCKESEIFIEAEKQTFQEKKELLERAMGIRKTSGSETTLMDKISDIEQAARKIEADMKESIERIKAESQKLYSLNTMEDQEQITSAAICDKQLNALNTQSHQTILIPDSTAFPGLASTVSGEFHKKSFVESSYEKVTRTGTPYENVESGYKREFRVATPSGFYDNNSEEVFRQEGRMEGFREMKLEQFSGAEEVLDQKFREITRREGVEPTYEYNCGYKRQSNQIQAEHTNSNMPTGNGPPPPPPPPCAGNIPAVRIASEIGPKKSYEPPAAIQNAMMTKDKKPFTYTPGGLNLNEIRSPRMARRISRNAHTEDSCSHPQNQAAQGPVTPPAQLPPAALAAMQPQIAIPVFPPGGAPPVPPPPPPPPSQGTAGAPVQLPPPPPPVAPVSPVNRPPDFPPRPEFLSDIASHPPLKPVGQPPRSSFEPSSAPPLQVQLKPVSPKPTPEPASPPSQQLPFVPRPPPPELPQSVNTPQQFRAAPPTPPPPVQPVTPPLGGRPAPQTPPIQSVRPPVTPPIASQKQAVTPPIQGQRAPATPPTPSLNKSPAPWLTNKPVPKESPPPWTVRQPSFETPPPTPPTPTPVQQVNQQGNQPVTRVIPIQIEGREPSPKASPIPTQQPPTPQQYAPSPAPQYSYPPQPQAPNSQQYRYVQPPPNFQNYMQPQAPPQYVQPQQYQQPYQQPTQPNYAQQQSESGRTRIIPIQIEGSNNGTQPPIYQTQNSYPGNGQMRTQNGDTVDARKFQTQTSYTGNPTQSRSFRVLQKITGSDDDTQKRLDESEY